MSGLDGLRNEAANMLDNLSTQATQAGDYLAGEGGPGSEQAAEFYDLATQTNTVLNPATSEGAMRIREATGTDQGNLFQEAGRLFEGAAERLRP